MQLVVALCLLASKWQVKVGARLTPRRRNLSLGLFAGLKKMGALRLPFFMFMSVSCACEFGRASLVKCVATLCEVMAVN
jgi:hypothetical protein